MYPNVVKSVKTYNVVNIHNEYIIIHNEYIIIKPDRCEKKRCKTRAEKINNLLFLPDKILIL